jgi:hypothetical protein
LALDFPFRRIHWTTNSCQKLTEAFNVLWTWVLSLRQKTR